MVAFHALQSLWYQVAWIVILSVGWFITYILMFVLIGFVLVPVMAIASVVPFVHQCYAAYKVSQGVDYRYPIIADRVDGERRVVLTRGHLGYRNYRQEEDPDLDTASR
jgi:uncharacterized membrane protein